MTRNTMRLALALVVVIIALPTPVVGQIVQQELAEQILSESHTDRYRAIRSILRMGPKNAGAELRIALFAALEREARLVAERNDALLAGQHPGPHPDPDFASILTEVIVALEDPESIPALAMSLGTGSLASLWALVDYGALAAPAVLEVESESNDSIVILWSLIVLRAMVERQATSPLPDTTLEAIRKVAEKRLHEKQEGAALPLRRAIDLAIVLGDPDLRNSVEKLANDAGALVALGISDSEVIERIQALAKERLEGVPPRPRHP